MLGEWEPIYDTYDSAGLAVRDGEALAQVVKAKGRLSNLIEKTDNGNALKGTCGIGHRPSFQAFQYCEGSGHHAPIR